ncbi:uncharacterized protein LOC135168489 [Diachasmimorpha longicaudata]|uniref:uncharacterized protein LOC135168489 n=1 Tax=Diachasmimorpha longicaudata TaxID=58733 RepID=UPI0030B8D837
MEATMQESPTADSLSWDIFHSVDSILSSSEASDDDTEEFFDDTCGDLEGTHEPEKSSSHGETEYLDCPKTEISHSANPQREESLAKRVASLKERITDLRRSLTEEQRLWRQELQEYEDIHEKMKLSALEAVTAVARAVSQAYIVESTKSETWNNGNFSSNGASVSSCKDGNSRSRCRNLFYKDYYERLDQIEKLCHQVLQKIRDDTEVLQPLRQIASQWGINDDNMGISDDVQEVDTNNYSQSVNIS